MKEEGREREGERERVGGDDMFAILCVKRVTIDKKKISTLCCAFFYCAAEAGFFYYLLAGVLGLETGGLGP